MPQILNTFKLHWSPLCQSFHKPIRRYQLSAKTFSRLTRIRFFDHHSFCCIHHVPGLLLDFSSMGGFSSERWLPVAFEKRGAKTFVCNAKLRSTAVFVNRLFNCLKLILQTWVQNTIITQQRHFVLSIMAKSLTRRVLIYFLMWSPSCEFRKWSRWHCRLQGPNCSQPRRSCKT